MGLFGNEKTSTDYLKEIAKSQKNQEKAAKVQAQAAKDATKENLSQKIEHLANAGKAWSEKNIRDAEAEAKRAETKRMRREAELAEEERCRQKLQIFYDSFEFNPNDLSDIEKKSMAIISWLDTVDRTFNDKKSRNVDDDNKSKEKTLIKKLALAVERLTFLNLAPAQLDYITKKLEFYNNRDIAEVEAKKNEIAKKRAEAQEREAALRARKKQKWMIVMSIIFGIVVIIGLKIIMPNPKTDSRDCEALIYKNIDKSNLRKAKKYVLNFRGNKSWIEDGVYKLITAFVECGDLDQAVDTYYHYEGSSHYELSMAFVEQGRYEEGYKYWPGKEYWEECIIHMCKNEKIDEARKYLKQVSLEIKDKKERAEWVQEMNQLINSYQY